MKTIGNTPIAFRFDSSVKAALFFNEGLHDLLLPMVYAGFKVKFISADAGMPAE